MCMGKRLSCCFFDAISSHGKMKSLPEISRSSSGELRKTDSVLFLISRSLPVSPARFRYFAFQPKISRRSPEELPESPRNMLVFQSLPKVNINHFWETLSPRKKWIPKKSSKSLPKQHSNGDLGQYTRSTYK